MPMPAISAAACRRRHIRDCRCREIISLLATPFIDRLKAALRFRHFHWPIMIYAS